MKTARAISDASRRARTRTRGPGARGGLGLAIAAAAVLLAAAAVPSLGPAAPADAPTLRVLASFLPMYVFALNVAGGRSGVALDMMLPAGLGCPHDYSLTPGDMKKIASADLFVVNGMGLEGFLGEAVRRANPKLVIVDTSAGIEPIRIGAGGAHAGHEDEHARNPHVWVSPRRAAVQVRAIGAAFALADPEGAREYAENAEGYAARLDGLASRIQAAVGAASNRRVIDFHGVFGHLAADSGLEVVGVIEEAAGQAPSPRGLARLVDLARSVRPAAILTEPQYPAGIARTLSRESGVPIHELDPFATGEPDPQGYEKVMEANIEALRRALGGGVAP